VMRCLALAQAWKDAGGRTVFLSTELTSALEQRLHAEDMAVRRLEASPGSMQDACQTASLSAKLAADWLVVDGFHFGDTFLSALHSTPILLIDDHGARGNYVAEVVVNPNIFATSEAYKGRCQGQLLAGPRYALLRREFRFPRAKLRSRGQGPMRLLITMGGSDADNVTSKILLALNQSKLPALEITILCGSANPHIAGLQNAAEQSQYPAEVIIDASDMARLLSSIDLAISAPGGTSLELACMGVPMLLVTIAENHARTADEFPRRRLAISAGWYDQLTVQELSSVIANFLTDNHGHREMSENGLKLIDGFGAERVVAAMLARKVAAAV
jgi:UDP-2,4-diacetamido-2,4,6-trideoxy-beta-L-altropyranose hydrolase